jgi:hypothetical protein
LKIRNGGSSDFHKNIPPIQMEKPKIINEIPSDLKQKVPKVDAIVAQFAKACCPLEKARLFVMVDARTGARYCECHIRAEKLIELGTIDVPLDPDEQSEYRANRDIVEDHVAFQRMKEDANERRTFSNIVAEFMTPAEDDRPLKIIGGQHRFNAIEEALDSDVNEFHGIKVYFQLTTEQRLDVQLISNTNIAASSDLFDRMTETQAGPDLRNWCQACGLLEQTQDFADKRRLGSAMTVRAARTFIVNYYLGTGVKSEHFNLLSTTPVTVKTGQPDQNWQTIRSRKPSIWKDEKLKAAAKEYAELSGAQRTFFAGRKANPDYEAKTQNFAVMSAWAFIAGLLHDNPTRLKRHFGLKAAKGKDPLNAAALAKGRHKTDPDNYRGLGYRVDAKERGRFVELFFIQAEKGTGITPALIDLAIKQYHAKLAVLEVEAAKQKSDDA